MCRLAPRVSVRPGAVCNDHIGRVGTAPGSAPGSPRGAPAPGGVPRVPRPPGTPGTAPPGVPRACAGVHGRVQGRPAPRVQAHRTGFKPV